MRSSFPLPSSPTRRTTQLACLVAILLGSHVALAAQFQLLTSPTAGSTYATGVSRDGKVVVGQLSTANTVEAFRATAQGDFVSLGDFPGGLAYSTAYATNQDGSVVVGVGYREDASDPSGVQVAFRWTSATGLVDLGDLDGGSTVSFASHVSADGNILVGAGYPASNDFVAWRWEAGTFNALGTFNASQPQSAAHGVSGDGTIVIGSSTGVVGGVQTVRAFRWTAADGMVDLGDLDGGSPYAFAAAISGDGKVIVGSSSSTDSGDSYLEACRWTDQGIERLKDLPGGSFGSEALATNADGSIVVGRSITDGEDGEEAFLWTQQDGMVRLADLATSAGLDLGSSVLRQATGVSDDGKVVVGIAETPTGAQAFRLDLHDDAPDAGPPDADGAIDGQGETGGSASDGSDGDVETGEQDAATDVGQGGSHPDAGHDAAGSGGSQSDSAAGGSGVDAGHDAATDSAAGTVGAQPQADSASDGCGCRLASHRSGGAGAALVLLALSLISQLLGRRHVR